MTSSSGSLAMSERFTPLLAAIWESAADKFAFKVGLDPNQWTVINPHTEAMIQQRARDFCQSTNESTSLKLDEALQQTRDALIEGTIEQGENLEQITKRISGIFDKLDKKVRGGSPRPRHPMRSMRPRSKRRSRPRW